MKLGSERPIHSLPRPRNAFAERVSRIEGFSLAATEASRLAEMYLRRVTELQEQ